MNFKESMSLSLCQILTPKLIPAEKLMWSAEHEALVGNMSSKTTSPTNKFFNYMVQKKV